MLKINQMLENAAVKVTSKMGNSGLVLRKLSPQILLTIGVGGVVGTIVWASYRSTKLGETLDECTKKMDDVMTPPDDFDDREEDYVPDRKEVGKVYLANVWSVVRLYAGPAALGALSIGMIVESHHIIHARNLALGAAYEAVDQAFKEYRGRVVEDLGEDADQQYRYGWETETVEKEVEGKNGKKKVVEEEVRVPKEKKCNDISLYARYFDETCEPFWTDDADKNLMFLKMQQNMLNDRLKIKKYVSLNEAYEALGLPPTSLGATSGWLRNKNHKDVIDFGIFNPITGCIEDNWMHRRTINRYEPVVLVEFNCRGDVYKEI